MLKKLISVQNKPDEVDSDLRTLPYYYPEIDRNDSNDALLQEGPGTFLLRRSKLKGKYVISCRERRDHITHYLVKHTEDKGFYVEDVKELSGKIFETMQLLIKKCQEVGYIKAPLVLSNRISRIFSRESVVTKLSKQSPNLSLNVNDDELPNVDFKSSSKIDETKYPQPNKQEIEKYKKIANYLSKKSSFEDPRENKLHHLRRLSLQPQPFQLFIHNGTNKNIYLTFYTKIRFRETFDYVLTIDRNVDIIEVPHPKDNEYLSPLCVTCDSPSLLFKYKCVFAFVKEDLHRQLTRSMYKDLLSVPADETKHIYLKFDIINRLIASTDYDRIEDERTRADSCSDEENNIPSTVSPPVEFIYPILTEKPEKDRYTPYHWPNRLGIAGTFISWGGTHTDYNNDLNIQPLKRIFDDSSQINKDDIIRISLFGDICPQSHDTSPQVDSELRKIVSRANLIVMNLEPPACLNKKQEGYLVGPNKLKNVTSKPFLSDLIKSFGVPSSRFLFSHANNHAADCMKDLGLSLSIRNIESLGATSIGISHQYADPYGDPRGSICRFELEGGCVIGIIAFTNWINRSSSPSVFRTSDIEDVDWNHVKEQQSINILIGYPHWDYENSTHPHSSTIMIAHKLISNGFDCIVGHGSHTLHPIEEEEIDGLHKIISYSVGNVCQVTDDWTKTLGGVFELLICPKSHQIIGYELSPIVQFQYQEGECHTPTILVPFSSLKKSDEVYYNMAERLAMNFQEGHKLLDYFYELPCRYCVRIYTGDKLGASTNATIYLVARGKNGVSPYWRLDDRHKSTFNRNSIDTFYLTSHSLGDLLGIHMVIRHLRKFDNWYFNRVEITEMFGEKKVFCFLGDRWMDKINPEIEIEENSIIHIDPILNNFKKHIYQFKTGDILLYQNYNSGSGFLKTVHSSLYTHCGILTANSHESIESNKRWISYERVSNINQLKDIETGEVYYSGVLSFGIKDILSNCPNSIWWLPLKKTLTKQQEEKLISNLKDQLLKRKRNVKQLQGTVLKQTDLFDTLGVVNHNLFDQVFCAEFVCSLLQSVNVISPKLNSLECSVKDLGMMSDVYNVDKMIRLKTW